MVTCGVKPLTCGLEDRAPYSLGCAPHAHPHTRCCPVQRGTTDHTHTILGGDSSRASKVAVDTAEKGATQEMERERRKQTAGSKQLRNTHTQTHAHTHTHTVAPQLDGVHQFPTSATKVNARLLRDSAYRQQLGPRPRTREQHDRAGGCGVAEGKQNGRSAAV